VPEHRAVEAEVGDGRALAEDEWPGGQHRLEEVEHADVARLDMGAGPRIDPVAADEQAPLAARERAPPQRQRHGHANQLGG
jgi:hypothetical protein